MQINIITQDSSFRFCFYPRVSLTLLLRCLSSNLFGALAAKFWKKKIILLLLSLYLPVRPSFRIIPLLWRLIIFFELFFLFYSNLGACAHFWSIGMISQFLDHSQSVGLLGRVISPPQGLYLNTEQHKHRIDSHRQWDFNPRSQRSSGRRRFIP
jgi:hypothetical protein